MGEDARRCSRCGYQWFAERVTKPAKTYGAGAGWSLLGGTGMAAAAGAKAGAHYSTKLERHERWKLCPKCGSSKVKTVPKRRFTPTAAGQPPEISDAPAQAPERPCPWCGEQILLAARKCKHCGEYLEVSASAEPSQAPPTPQAVWRFGGMAWKCIAHEKMSCQPCAALVKPPWRAGKKGDLYPPA